jgi:hypothetical protein
MFAPEQHDVYDGHYILSANRICAAADRVSGCEVIVYFCSNGSR